MDFYYERGAAIDREEQNLGVSWSYGRKEMNRSKMSVKSEDKSQGEIIKNFAKRRHRLWRVIGLVAIRLVVGIENNNNRSIYQNRC